MLTFNLSSQAPVSKSVNPTRGELTENPKATAFMKENPIIGRFLAIKDWGESPWKIQHIVSEAVLCFERSSSDSEKKEIAKKTSDTINIRIDSAKGLYSKLLKENGGESDITLKLKDDISFMENMRNVIDAQVNGLVSRQKSWKMRAEDLQGRYAEQLKIKSWWENVRTKYPWVYVPIGIAAGAAASWFTEGWNAAVQLTQYAFHLGHGSKLILENMKPITDVLFGVASAVGLGAIGKKIAANSEMMQEFYTKHLKGSTEVIKKHAAFIGTLGGATIGIAVFGAGALDGIITFARAAWERLHTDPNVVQYINPLVKFAWNVGGMVFFGWALHHIDTNAFARKQKILGECEAKQKEIVDEEKVFRRKIIGIIKEKAIELHAKYGYCVELDKEDTEIVALAEQGNWTLINEIHKARMKKIFGSESISDELMAGAESDSNSTDTVVRVPMDEKPLEKPPVQS